ncbi:Enterobactin exporter EntS [Paenibacillus plantiphilus]|uniref:Enterobactin exporter EntS n=1 Tax=Paenibacillus plantiphilus TaxID=2905650 RepID=A0ABN8GK64_9BACL|nr:MFS transporter [Paenibacillus plantiphilus]CAH1209528.1 Enterobactin exporter EntS [Paenibacillus plantiphilus]
MLVQVMLVKEWNATSFQFGLFEACIPIGYIVGAAMIMKWDQRFTKRGLVILGGMLLLGPVFISLSFIPSAWLGMPLILVHGFLFSYCTVLATTLLRMRIDEHIQGRVFAMISSITTVAPPIGIAVCSYLADVYSASNVLLVNGLLLLTAAILFTVFMKSIRDVA